MSNRELQFPQLLNARDLGGCRTKDGRETRWRALVRADDLARLTREGAQALLAYGVRTIIDLRWPADGETHPNLLQKTPGTLHQQQLSLLGASVETWQAVRALGPKEQFNCLVLQHFQPELLAVLQAIAAAPPGGILFHCVSGKDRTGVVAALLLTLVDVETETIVQDYVCSTAKLRDAYLAAYPDEQAATLERVRCPPEQIHNMLAYIAARYGDTASYLHAIGLSQGEVGQLQERLLGI